MRCYNGGVAYLYKDLCQHKITNPDYTDIIYALGPVALKLMSDVYLQKTECRITMEELSNCLKKTQNNTAHDLSGFTGKFYKMNWSILKHLVLKVVHQIHKDNCLH